MGPQNYRLALWGIFRIYIKRFYFFYLFMSTTFQSMLKERNNKKRIHMTANKNKQNIHDFKYDFKKRFFS